MARNRFVRPDVVTLPLSEGDTITIRKELNAGEMRAMSDRARIPDTFPPRTDPMKAPTALVVAYLVDWSFIGEDGARVDIRGYSAEELTAVLDSLNLGTLNEIVNAINAHVATESALEKKILNGENVS